jgi:hypothetical protein
MAKAEKKPVEVVEPVLEEAIEAPVEEKVVEPTLEEAVIEDPKAPDTVEAVETVAKVEEVVPEVKEEEVILPTEGVVAEEAEIGTIRPIDPNEVFVPEVTAEVITTSVDDFAVLGIDELMQEIQKLYALDVPDLRKSYETCRWNCIRYGLPLKNFDEIKTRD